MVYLRNNPERNIGRHQKPPEMDALDREDCIKEKNSIETDDI